MARCEQCGAIFFHRNGESSTDPSEARCPLCLLSRTPPNHEVPNGVERMARAALGFETTGDIRERILRRVPGGSTDQRSGGFRKAELEAVADALCGSRPRWDDVTNRELRAYIAECAGLDATASTCFRKDDLIELALVLLRRYAYGGTTPGRESK